MQTTVCSSEDANFIDKQCDWAIAKHWAQWWTKSSHLQMLSKAFSPMEKEVWQNVLQQPRQWKEKKTVQVKSTGYIKLAMIKVHIMDKVACFSHVHVCQQCIVRGWGWIENKERSQEDQRHY